MDELTRLQYLEKMGVVTYNARFPLPAAKASLPLEVGHQPAPDKATIASAAMKPAKNMLAESGVRLNSAADIRARFFNEDGNPKTPAPAPVAGEVEETIEASSSVEAAETVFTEAESPLPREQSALETLLQGGELILPLFQPLPSVLALNQPGRLDTVHFRLLRNIFTALGQESRDTSPLRQFEWRREHGRETCVDGVRERLLAFVEGFQMKFDSRYLLLMGEIPQRCFMGDDTYPAMTDQLPDIRVICIPSLQQMIGQPESKKAAWKALSPLIGKL